MPDAAERLLRRIRSAADGSLERGEHSGAILPHSRRLSGKEPVYEVFDNELRLTIYAADRAAEGST